MIMDCKDIELEFNAIFEVNEPAHLFTGRSSSGSEVGTRRDVDALRQAFGCQWGRLPGDVSGAFSGRFGVLARA